MTDKPPLEAAQAAPDLPDDLPAPAPDELPESIPAAVPVPMSPFVRVYQGVAFALSAILSPYLVIPAGAVGIVAAQMPSGPYARRKFFLWTALSVFFSTVVPALFVVIQMLRGKISDVHVMEREQRGGPFLVAILSSAVGAWVLKFMGAPLPVWCVGVVLSVNGIVMLGITAFWKISIHVSVLSATVLAGILLIPELPRWPLLILVPALIWARVTRGRHSIWQGISGCGIASLVTAGVLYGLKSLYHLDVWWATTSSGQQV